MNRSLTGKVAIVTGGSKGIGRAIVLKLSSLGAEVIINYAGDSNSAEGLARTVVDNGDKAHVIRADVSRVEEIEKLFQSTITRCGQLDIVINNAGTATYKPIADFTEEEFDN